MCAWPYVKIFDLICLLASLCTCAHFNKHLDFYDTTGVYFYINLILSFLQFVFSSLQCISQSRSKHASVWMLSMYPLMSFDCHKHHWKNVCVTLRMFSTPRQACYVIKQDQFNLLPKVSSSLPKSSSKQKYISEGIKTYLFAEEKNLIHRFPTTFSVCLEPRPSGQGREPTLGWEEEGRQPTRGGPADGATPRALVSSNDRPCSYLPRFSPAAVKSASWLASFVAVTWQEARGLLGRIRPGPFPQSITR